MTPGTGQLPAGRSKDLHSPEHRGVVSISGDGRQPEKVRAECANQRDAWVGRGREAGRVPLTLVEAAGYLNVTERYMRRLVAERRIPYFKLGRLLRFWPQISTRTSPDVGSIHQDSIR